MSLYQPCLPPGVSPHFCSPVRLSLLQAAVLPPDKDEFLTLAQKVGGDIGYHFEKDNVGGQGRS